MFRIFMRGIVNWTSGFGRYLDLMVATMLIALAAYWSDPISAVLGFLALASFAFDVNGRFQRWTMTRMLGRLGVR